MKKWISMLLAGILVSSVLVGCSKTEEETTTPPASTATTGAEGAK